jgi:hypothetical protein
MDPPFRLSPGFLCSNIQACVINGKFNSLVDVSFGSVPICIRGPAFDLSTELLLKHCVSMALFFPQSPASASVRKNVSKVLSLVVAV